MTELEKYEAVNKCETFKELRDVIVDISYNGIMQGRTKSFSLENMLHYCSTEGFLANPNGLTRMYGIRQQAFYIQYYS